MSYPITKIEGQKKQKNRYSVYSNEEFLVGVSSDTLLAFDLFVGKTISESDLRAIKKQEQQVAVSAAAARYLARRPHSRKELRDKLLRKDLPAGVIDRILDDFEKRGYLNDRDYARLLIDEEKRLRSAGPKAIRNKLLTRGVSREICDELLATMYSFEEQQQHCLKVATKKIRSYHAKPAGEQKKRLAAFLSGKGFDWEIIYSVIDSIISGDENEIE